MKRWEAQIPKIPSNRDRKRCYSVWTKNYKWRLGGKIVWLTDRELTFYQIKYSKKVFLEILERDKLEEYKKYLDATVD